MASTDSSNWSLVSKPPAAKPRSLMLKDYLRDDMSSCSSNGFRSFPRRQCCTTTVRFLLEVDLKVKDSSVVTKRFVPRTASRKIALTTISTLQRASDAVVRAFKQFPLPSSRKPFLTRSISRKLILRAFWRKSDTVDPKARPWKSFQEFLNEKEPPSSSDQNRSDSAVCTAIAVAGSRNSISSWSNSISWTESEFTSEMIPSSSSGNSESCSENDAVKDDKDSPGYLLGKRDGVAFGKDSMEETTTAPAAAAATTTTGYGEDTVKQWPNEEEKEQFSPVSVLDFSFDDEDQDISSSFNCNLHFVEGKKQKHTQKMTRLENNGAESLEPLDLKKRFSDIGGIGREDLRLTSKSKERQREQKAFELLRLLKSTTTLTKSQCFFILKTENLLLDFFHEKLEENEATTSSGMGDDCFEAQLLKLTEDWIDDGEAVGEIMVMRWELPEGRNLHIKDMEMAGKWRSVAGEKEELAAECEAEVWMSLLDELLIDLSWPPSFFC